MNKDEFITAVKQLLKAEDTNNYDTLYDKISRLKHDYDIYYMAIDNCIDSFHIADGDGTVLFINKTFENKSKVMKKDIIGLNVDSMESLYKPSVVRMALTEGRRLTAIQNGPAGPTCTTATPVFDENGKAVLCVSNARFIDEINILERYYRESNQTDTADTVEIAESDLICNDPAVKKIYDSITHVANTDSSILITGETGTGKSLLARYVHNQSHRRDKKFVELNCASIPENLIESELFGYESGAFTGAKKGGKPGLFEIADGGTVFLDEIGDMPLALQVKLLHALQNRKVMRIGGTTEIPIDVRIITATNKNLEAEIESGNFRSDLYYRIKVIPVDLPPLRDRPADLEALIDVFMNKYKAKYSINVDILHDAIDILHQYPWPGNIRELENMIEMLVVTNRDGVITSESLPTNVRISKKVSNEAISVNRIIPLAEAQRIVERELVKMAFEDYNSSYKAADVLGISQSGASRKYHKYLK